MALSKITVYTAISGEKDNLIEDQCGPADFVAFMDKPSDSKLWQIRPGYQRFSDPRRNSRIQKLMPHLYLDTEYSIYIDGNISLLKSPEEIIAKYLKDHDVAVYKHPNRDCVYAEAAECAIRRLDDAETLIEQAKAYEDEGYAKHKGLCECGIIIRRHSAKVERFNEAWWAEYCRYSRRDQISFMHAVDRTGLRVNMISDFFIEQCPTKAIKQSGDFQIITHNHQL